jgi:hypothetical protein
MLSGGAGDLGERNRRVFVIRRIVLFPRHAWLRLGAASPPRFGEKRKERRHANKKEKEKEKEKEKHSFQPYPSLMMQKS